MFVTDSVLRLFIGFFINSLISMFFVSLCDTGVLRARRGGEEGGGLHQGSISEPAAAARGGRLRQDLPSCQVCLQLRGMAVAHQAYLGDTLRRHLTRVDGTHTSPHLHLSPGIFSVPIL